MKTNLKELSKQTWNGEPTLEGINAGSLQRIATATETMAGNYTRLQNDLTWTEQRLKEVREQNEKLRRSNAALRGHIRRLKNNRIKK